VLANSPTCSKPSRAIRDALLSRQSALQWTQLGGWTLRRQGLNENLAREILELHTLGAEGGYSQDDVTALARILTGWSIAQAESEVGTPGAFLFKSNWHEPGAQILLGETYAQTGCGRAKRRSPISPCIRPPRRISPQSSSVTLSPMTRRRHDREAGEGIARHGGDLRAVTVALAGDDEAWRLPMTKIRTHNEFLIAAMRATGSLPPSLARSSTCRTPSACRFGSRRTQWFRRHASGLGDTRVDEASSRCRRATRPARQGCGESAQRAR